MHDRMSEVRRAADVLIYELEAFGDHPEIRIAQARAEEAVMWAQRIAVPKSLGDPASIRSLFVDIFERIAAAITAKNSGDVAALQEHVSAIDAHLAQIDETDTDEQSRIGNIEAGLGKIADAVNPPAPSSDTSGASGTDTSGAGSTDGSTAPQSDSSAAATDQSGSGSGSADQPTT